MNRDELIRMAREAGFDCYDGFVDGVEINLARFASLVAAHERDECAKVCDEQQKAPECPERAAYCAAAIRARGKP